VKPRKPTSKRPAKRNPLARALREGIYRKPRVVERTDRYKRRPKHRKRTAPEEAQG
jgi:hypothetical protein